MTLHYRHVNQAVRWETAELKLTGDSFTGEIPAAYTDHRYALQYYFEIETSPTEATLHPVLNPDLADTPYHVVRREM